MICFPTSRTDLPDSDHLYLNPANGLIDELRRVFPTPCRVLAVCSDPDNWERTDFYAAAQKTSFQNAGLFFEQFKTLDGRNEAEAEALVREANLLILCGGHVPTQNRFFQRIGLKALLRGFDGVLIGVSAGSMNSAETVYAQPELPGEAIDPEYRRFLPGLGLTDKMILPHYQAIKDEMLDGLRIMEDIAYPDSRGRRIYLLPDGSYILIADGKEEVRGEAWLLADGVLSPL
jgi:dipeptidase E